MNTPVLTLHESLAKVQQELNVPKGQTNNFGGYTYRSAEDILQALKPLLLSVGATVTMTDDVILVGDRIYVKSEACFTVKDGHIISTGFAREAETKKGMDVSQITGAASSYSRKYALNGLFMIDDNKDADDTNDHGLTLSYVGRLQVIKDSYPTKFIRVAMTDWKIEKLTDLPECECDSFEQMIQGLVKSDKEGEL